MSLNVSILRHDGFVLKGTADIAAGWRRNERGYGFFARGILDYPGNRILGVTMNVRVKPLRSFGHFAEFPKDLETSGSLLWQGEDDVALYAAKNGKAGVAIAAGSLAEELERNEGDLLYFDKVVLLARGGRSRVRIEMSIGLGVHAVPPEPVGDIPEWDTQFFQGGLPSLGKRRP